MPPSSSVSAPTSMSAGPSLSISASASASVSVGVSFLEGQCINLVSLGEFSSIFKSFLGVHKAFLRNTVFIRLTALGAYEILGP